MGPGDRTGMTLGAVRASPTQHRGPLGKCLENGPLGTLGRDQRAKWTRLENTDWPEIQKMARHPKLPAHSVGHPPTQCYILPRWDGCSWGTCTPPSVSPHVWLSLGHWPSDPGTHLASRALAWSSILSLPPHPPPKCLQQDPLLGPSLCHHLKTPHATNTCVTCAACVSAAAPCLPQLNPFNMLIFLAKSSAWVLSLTC